MRVFVCVSAILVHSLNGIEYLENLDRSIFQICSLPIDSIFRSIEIYRIAWVREYWPARFPDEKFILFCFNRANTLHALISILLHHWSHPFANFASPLILMFSSRLSLFIWRHETTWFNRSEARDFFFRHIKWVRIAFVRPDKFSWCSRFRHLIEKSKKSKLFIQCEEINLYFHFSFDFWFPVSEFASVVNSKRHKMCWKKNTHTLQRIGHQQFRGIPVSPKTKRNNLYFSIDRKEWIIESSFITFS